MTDPSSTLGEAILLRLSDRLSNVEQEAAASAEALRAVSDSVTQLRQLITALTHDFDTLRSVSTDALANFEKMRTPLQDLLDLKARLSGVWLAITALLMVIAYLAQPVLGELLHRHFGG